MWVAMPLILLADRFAHYGARSQLALFMVEGDTTRGLGLARDEAGRLYDLFAEGVAIAPIFGALVIFIFGPRFAAALGALLTAGSLFVLAGGSAAHLLPFIVLHVLGTGLLRPAWYVLAARLFDVDEHRARGLLFVLFHGALLFGASVGPAAVGLLGAFGGFSAAFLACAMLEGTAALATLLLITKLPRDTKTDASPMGDGRRLGSAALLCAGVVLWWVAIVPVYEVMHRATLGEFALDRAVGAALVALQGTSFWLTLGVALFFALRLWLSRATPHRPLLPVGLGFIVGALSLAVLAGLLTVGGQGGGAFLALCGATLGAGLGEALVLPFSLAFVAAATRSRAAGLIVAAWLLAGGPFATWIGALLQPWGYGANHGTLRALALTLAIIGTLIVVRSGRKLRPQLID